MDIKKVLQKEVEMGRYSTLGELYSAYCTDSLLNIMNSRENFEEFKKFITEVTAKHGLDSNTSINEVLKKL